MGFLGLPRIYSKYLNKNDRDRIRRIWKHPIQNIIDTIDIQNKNLKEQKTN